MLHRDGKILLQAGCHCHHEDRIAVIASGVNFKELLAVPVANDGSGMGMDDMGCEMWV